MPERTAPPRVSLLGKRIQLKLNPDNFILADNLYILSKEIIQRIVIKLGVENTDLL
jgi:hypothetical protein